MNDPTTRRPAGAAAALAIRLLAAPPLLLLAAACGAPPAEGPELVLTGGTVYHTDLRTAATAVAIEDDRIVAIGTDQEIRALATDDSQEMPLDGAVVLPGIQDVWIDLEALGRDDVDLSLTTSPREVRARLREAMATSSGWIVGRGWDETNWPRPALPTHGDLDETVPDRPVLLIRAGGDVGWVNRAALEAAGLRVPGDDVAGLLTDPDGRPTGIVAGPALERVRSAMPVPSARTLRDRLAEAGRRIAAAGITTVITAPTGPEVVAALRSLEETGDLSVRARVRLSPAELPEAADSEAARDLVEPGELVRVVAAGLTLDGPFRPGLAALAEPDAKGRVGTLWSTGEEISTACSAAERLGLRLDVRARGDRAIATALDACPDSAGEGWIVGGDLPPRSLPDGLHFAVAPSRMTHDLYWLEQLLGSERAGRAHAYRDLLAAGTLVGIATEAPAWPLDPMAAIRAMVTRRDPEGYPLDGWRPAQRISAGDAFRVATGRLLSGAEGLTEGAVADLVVWSEDPLADPGALESMRAMVTVVAGRVVYSRPLVDLPFEME